MKKRIQSKVGRVLVFARAVTLLGMGAFVSACPSLTTSHTARPLPVGEVESSFAVGVYKFDGNDEDAPLLIEGQIRKGLAENFDAGLKLTSYSLVQADLNYALVQSENFALSIDPTVSIIPIPGFVGTYVWLPVLADVYSSDNLTVTLSARYGFFFINSTGSGPDTGPDESTGLYGAGIGLRYRVSEDLSIMPEFHVVVPTNNGLDSEVLYTISLGFIF